MHQQDNDNPRAIVIDENGVTLHHTGTPAGEWIAPRLLPLMVYGADLNARTTR